MRVHILHVRGWIRVRGGRKGVSVGGRAPTEGPGGAGCERDGPFHRGQTGTAIRPWLGRVGGPGSAAGLVPPINSAPWIPRLGPLSPDSLRRFYADSPAILRRFYATRSRCRNFREGARGGSSGSLTSSLSLEDSVCRLCLLAQGCDRGVGSLGGRIKRVFHFVDSALLLSPFRLTCAVR